MEKILLSWICIVETEENENCFFHSTSLRKKNHFSRFLNFWHLTWLFSRESYFVHSKGSKALALTFIWDTLYKNIIRGFSWRFFVRSPLRSTIVCPFVWCLSDFSYQVSGEKFLQVRKIKELFMLSSNFRPWRKWRKYDIFWWFKLMICGV